MNIDYTSVIGVGVLEKDITYKSLTNYGKKVIQEVYNNNCCEDGSADLNEWFSDNIGEYNLWFELRLEQNTGNYFTGESGYRGVSVDLNNIQEAKERFNEIIDLEPEVFNDVLVW